MPKVPYERLAPEANKLIEKMTAARDLKTISYWYDIYVSLLEAAGWDPISFDREAIKRIDEGWEDPDPTIWN
jgi:hypothetical protein